MCRVLKVSRSGFYAWLNRGESGRAREDRALAAEVKQIFDHSKGAYGAPRIRHVLARRNKRCGRKRVARLMREQGLRGRAARRFRVRTTDSRHNLPVAPNLVKRNFEADGPNKLWVADITHISTREGWLYLASILDVFSRKIVGWAAADHMRTSLVLAALTMAVRTRRPGPGLIHHSDRGSQYASREYRKALQDIQAGCSMSRKGDCFDNAMKESWFHSMKVELGADGGFATRAAGRAAVFEYIEMFYNRERAHSALGYLSPAEFEALAGVVP